MRPGGGAHASDKLSRPADGRLEADAVIGAGHVVIHGFGDAPGGDALCRKYGGITQGVVAPDHYQSIQFKKAYVRQHLVSEVNAVVRRMTFTVSSKVWRQVTDLCARRIGARRLQDGAAAPINGACIEPV